MATLTIVSLNSQGLGSPEKCCMILSNLPNKEAHVVFLQETHFPAPKMPTIKDLYFSTAFHLGFSDKTSRGVSILFANRVVTQ